MVNSKLFKFTSFLIILANTIVLGLTKDNESESYNMRLENLNLFFFCFFCVEIVAKLLGQGFKYYIRDRFNWFDGGVVFFSAIDITMVNTLKYMGNSK
jgi:hypothetical protein